LISVRCFHSLAEAASLREDIDALNLLSPQPDPFSTFAFYENYLDHDHGIGSAQLGRPWFLAAFRADRLIGFMALRAYARKFFGVRSPALGFLVTHDTDRPHVVARAEDLAQVSAAFCSYLLGRGDEWSLLELQQQDDASLIYSPPALRGYMVREWPSLENCTVQVRWDTSREYFQALSKKARSNVGRQARALLGAGNVELLTSSNPRANAALFDLYRRIEPRSWKAQAKVNIGRDSARVAYFRGLMQPGQPMQIGIQVLLLDRTPIAGLITGGFMRGLYALQTVYDRRLSQYGPGSTMLFLGMQQAIEGGHRFFNLLSGFRYYKVRWLADVTETRVTQIYRSGSLPYWHRRFGDWKRRWLPAQEMPGSLLFNPVRRRADVEDETNSSGALESVVSSGDERRRLGTLIDAVRTGGGRFFSAQQLAAVLPFETGRPWSFLSNDTAAQACSVARTEGDDVRSDSAMIPTAEIVSPSSMPINAPTTPNRTMAA
jgi:hypothetical protein